MDKEVNSSLRTSKFLTVAPWSCGWMDQILPHFERINSNLTSSVAAWFHCFTWGSKCIYQGSPSFFPNSCHLWLAMSFHSSLFFLPPSFAASGLVWVAFFALLNLFLRGACRCESEGGPAAGAGDLLSGGGAVDLGLPAHRPGAQPEGFDHMCDPHVHNYLFVHIYIYIYIRIS